MKSVIDLIEYLKANDLPGWVTAAWSLLFWPLAVWWWNDRKRSGLPGLDITPRERAAKPIKVGDKACTGVQFNFINKTQEIVYLTDVAIVDHSDRFEPATDADRTLTETYELKFLGPDKRTYHLRQMILQTNEEAQTVLPVIIPDMTAFLKYRRSTLRALFFGPRYFALEFVAMVGQKRRRVRIVY